MPPSPGSGGKLREADFVQLCRDGLAAIKAGDTVFTARLKGLAGVFAEALGRSTATAAIRGDVDPA